MTPTHEQAVTLARQGEFGRARDLLQQLHAVNPHDTAVLYDYALCLSEMGDKAESIPLFQNLLDLAPDHVNGRVALGIAFAATGQVAEAKAAFQQAVELDPGNQYAVRSLGALAARAGEDCCCRPRGIESRSQLVTAPHYSRPGLASMRVWCSVFWLTGSSA